MNTYVELVGTVTAADEMAGEVLLDLGNDFGRLNSTSPVETPC